MTEFYSISVFILFIILLMLFLGYYYLKSSIEDDPENNKEEDWANKIFFEFQVAKRVLGKKLATKGLKVWYSISLLIWGVLILIFLIWIVFDP